MALNTLKSSAEQFIEEGGWARLDEMRKACLTARTLTSGRSGAVHIKVDRQKDKSAELMAQLDIERRYRIRLQMAYEALLERLRSMAKSDPEIGHFINRHVAGFSFKRLSEVGKDADVANK